MTDITLDQSSGKLMVSHSQINVYNRCSFRWHLNYRKNWTPKEEPVYFARGHMIHEACEVYYKGIKEGTLAIGDASFVKSLMQKWITQDQDLMLVSAVGKLVERYVKEFSPMEDRGLKVLDVEKRLTMDLITPKGREFTIQCIFDLLCEVAGLVWLVDHKSIGSPRFRTENQMLMDAQLPLYVACLREHGIDVHGIALNFFNTYQYKGVADTEKLFRRMPAYRTQLEIDNILLELKRSVDAIYDDMDNPRRVFAYDCDRCAFQKPCLENLRGLPIDAIMPADYKQKEQRPAEDDLAEGE